MKKVIRYFLTVLLSATLMGCSSETAKKEQENYVVVEMPDATNVDDLFEFESVSQIALTGEMSNLGVGEGCYCIGALQGKNSVVWRSDNDGYDGGLFVFVEDDVSNTQVITYAAKLKETPISYDSFREKYK